MVIFKKPLLITALVLSLVATVSSFANDTTSVPTSAKQAEAAVEEVAATPALSEEAKAELEREEFIQHHLLDSHEFHLFSYGKESGEEKHVGFPLPVIFYDEGFHFFMSSAFHHGESVVESNGKYYKLYHEKIYRTDAAGTLMMDHHNHPENIQPLDLSITKNIFMVLVASGLMFFLFVRLAKSYKKNNGVATGVGRFFEPIVLFIRDDIAIPNIGEKHYKKYMSHLLTVFFFIWFLNLFGLTPLGVNVTNNIAITAALAILTYVITTFTANKNYWGHIFWMPGVPAPMKLILAPIELLGTFIKPFSLTVRLYANMLAGHVVLMSIIGMMYTFNNVVGSGLSFVLAFALSILEILVAGLQAYIFTMLTALYFGSANEEHHHEDGHH